MKGIVLAGGTGSRLRPLTGVPDSQNPELTKKQLNNKHLLPIYDKQLVLYPILKLHQAGISNIVIVTGGEKPGDFLELLGSGRDLWVDGKKIDVELTFRFQDKSGGIAEAASLCKDFVDGESCAIILGDNLIEADITPFVNSFKGGAKVLLKKVPDPHHFGVAKIQDGQVVKITEKPPKDQADSNLAVIGCYLYDQQIWDILPTLKPSRRAELEITDVNNEYIRRGCLSYDEISGFWLDSGSSFRHLLKASMWAAHKSGEDLHAIIEEIQND